MSVFGPPHPLDVDLADLVDGLLDATRAAAVASHVADCIVCRLRRDRLRDAPPAGPPDPGRPLPSTGFPVLRAGPGIDVGAGTAGEPVVGEIRPAGTGPMVLVVVLGGGDGWASVAPVTFDVEAADGESVVVLEEHSPLATGIVLHPGLVTEVPGTLLGGPVASFGDAAELADVLSGSGPGGHRGPAILDPSDPRIEVRQHLADLMQSLVEGPAGVQPGSDGPAAEVGGGRLGSLVDDLAARRGSVCAVRPLPGWADVEPARRAGWQPIATIDEVGIVLAVFDTPHGLSDDDDFHTARAVLTRFNATAVVVLAGAVSDLAEVFDASSLNHGIDAPSGRHTAPRPLISGLSPVDAMAKFLDQTTGTRMAAPPSRGPMTRVDVGDILREAAGTALAEAARQGSRFKIAPKRRGYESVADAATPFTAALGRAFESGFVVQDLLDLAPWRRPMIRHIALENWRAYRSLGVDVLPGTTFLVAPNGVGKSSLLEAVRWVLAGGHVDSRASMIRQGHQEATAAVTLDVADGLLVVTRSLRAKGSRLTAETAATLDGRPVEEAEAMRMLEESWSADPRFVSRTAFLTEDLRRDAEEPNLRTHLCRAYSLDDLQRAIAEIDPVLGQLSKRLKTSRAELSGTEQQLVQARTDLAALVGVVAAARAAVDAARLDHAATRAALDQDRAAAAQRAAAVAWRQGHDRLRDEATTTGLVPPVVEPEGRSLVATLSALEDELGARVEALRQQEAVLRARSEAAEAALATLLEAGASCPVCLRELDDDSRERAEHLHRTALEVAADVLVDLADPAPAVALRSVRELARRAAALGAPPPEPPPEPVDDLVESEQQALSLLEAAAAALREAELAEQAAAARVEAIRVDLETAGALTEQYRAEALLEAAKSALNQTITTVLGRQLQPVAAEVNRRWEAVFPDRPNLHVLPDGQMSRMIDGDQLEFGAFSAGEQTVAKLMMRLTTLLATTTVPFCWVDEPLEHLDPVSRQLVGSTLAHLSAAGGLEQIFVTTYEEPLARRLAELQPDRVRVQYLRTEPAR